MPDDNDGRRPLEAQVSYASEHARVGYVPTLVSQVEIRAAIAKAGFEALELGGSGEDAEAQARKHELSMQRRLLLLGLIFTLPLFVLSMARDFGWLPAFFYVGQAMPGAMRESQPWLNWIMWALATPVQFYVGWQYYVGAYKALRSGSANMDVLIAMGSSAAYFYSVVV